MIPSIQWGQTVRCFSSTARTQRFVIAHVGKTPIKLPPTVTLAQSPNELSLVGPLGKTSIPLEPFMQLNFSEPGLLTIAVENPNVKHQRAMWGTIRTLIHNAVVGMSEGFTVPLYLVGVGYRATLEADPRGTSDGGNGQRLNMKLGFSHSVLVPIPPHIKAEVPLPTKIAISCNDKHQLGLFAAKIKSYRKPEPYKGKGIFIGREQIRIKSIKRK